MKKLLLPAFILIMVLFPSCKWLRQMGFIGKKADTLVVWRLKQESLRAADSIKNVQNRILALENAKLDSTRKADQEKQDWESKFRYNIILGSFITPEYARRFAADLSQKGYRTRILKLEGTQFEMVSAEAHENFSSAVRRLKQFQDTISLDAWLYVVKKK